MNLNEIKAERNDVFVAAEALLARAKNNKQDLKGADLAQYNGLVASLKTLDKQIEELSQYGAARQSHSSPVSMGRTADGRSLPIFGKGQSVEAYMRQEVGSSEDGEVTLGSLARGMVLGGGSPAVRAALSEGSDSAGGVTVPVVLSSQLIDALRARCTVFQAGAETMLLDTGKSTTLAAIVSDPTAAWTTEGASVNVSDASFSPVTLIPKTLSCMVVASRQLIEDSENINQALMISIAASFAQELDRVALLGTGTPPQPKGLSAITGVGSYSMGTNGSTVSSYDPFVQALAILRGANAADPSAVIINPRTDLEINLLKDSQNRPLSRPKAIENLPFLVTSKLPITETQGSANTACRAVMGNFPELIVGMRAGLRVELMREKYSDTLQYGFLCYLRADIAVKHAASFVNILGIL